jgi:hypothetical protein
MENVMTQKTATMEAGVRRPLFKTDLRQSGTEPAREFGRGSPDGESKFPPRLADFAHDYNLIGASSRALLRAHAVGFVMGSAFTGAAWAAWAIAASR